MKKRSIKINGHATSLSLEDAFWEELKFIAEDRGQSLASLIAEIDDTRDVMNGNLSSALRLFVLETVKDKHKD